MNRVHGGDAFHFARLNGCRIDEVTDFSASINPLGMSPMAVRRVQERGVDGDTGRRAALPRLRL